MPMVGDLLADRYEIEGVLGAGGMAAVYKAIDLRLQREVAVKVLLPNLAADPLVAARFEREARALAGAAHHGIVGVFDVESGDPATGREPFYVMELCDGGSLADRLEEHGSLAPPEVVPTIAAIAEGLAAIHSQGLIHRDVKPHNILFCGDRPKLGDFGLARSERPTELVRLTADGATLGTLPYLAPELLGGGGEPTTASDVFGLAVTAYQALTGELPRPAGSLREMVEGWAAVPPLASTVAPTLGTAFDAPLAAALAVEPAERPSPQDFGAALSAAAAGWSPASSAGTSYKDAKTAAVAIANVPAPALAAQTETTILPAAAAEPVAEVAAPEPPGHPASLPRLAPAIAALSTRATRPLTGLRIDRPMQRRLLGAAAGIVGLAAFIVVAAILSRTVDTSGFFDVNPVVSPTASPSAEPTASQSPAASSPALAAVDQVLAAIQAARGGPNGLKGNEANDLVSLTGRVRSALVDADYEKAREAAQALADKAEKVAKGLDKERRTRLLDAIHALREAIPEA